VPCRERPIGLRISLGLQPTEATAGSRALTEPKQNNRPVLAGCEAEAAART